MSASSASREFETGLENVQFLDLLLQYKKVRSRTERICTPLQAEDAQLQSMPDVSPPKWHLAHTTWFFENFLLKPGLAEYSEFDPSFHFLFNSYYKSQGDHLLRQRRGLLSRPTLEQVWKYREYVDQNVFRLLSLGSAGANPGFCWADLRERITLGLHHEQQHQELLLTDIQYNFGMHPLEPEYEGTAPRFAEVLVASEFVDVPGGLVRAGNQSDDFSFDNERPYHCVFLEPYQLSNRLVTCGEYLEFIDAGGYRDPRYWLSDAWDLIQKENWQAPLYWKEERNGLWTRYSLKGRSAVIEREPVSHLSFYEADAYARWKGARLPTEFEWEHAVRTYPLKLVGVGQNWEWTRSAYLPYPGYQAFQGEFAEYNGKFMSGQMVLRGGSIASPPGHLRVSYRNFFPPQARWQFSGVRLAL